MQIPVANLINAASPSASATTAELPGAGDSSTPFANVLRDAISQVQGLESEAVKTVDGLITGQGVDVHTALIATQKADAAFEMALAFRNKAVSAYQQLMGTQF